MIYRILPFVVLFLFSFQFCAWADEGKTSPEPTKIEDAKEKLSDKPSDEQKNAKKDLLPPDGPPAPQFHLTRIKGGSFSSVKLKDHVVLLAFWASWCEPCKAELRALQTLFRKYESKGFTIVGINTDESRNKSRVRSLARSLKVHFPMLIDPENAHLAKINPALEIPYTVLVDKKGRIRMKKQGYLPGDEHKLEPMIEQLLGE